MDANVSRKFWLQYYFPPEHRKFPLVAHAGIYLTENDSGGDQERFAVAFRTVWRRLPRQMKITILEWWRSNYLRLDIGYGPLWPEPQAMGKCWEIGRMWFNSKVLDLMPNEIMRAVIRHELCHAFIYGRVGDHDEMLARLLNDDLAGQMGADEVDEQGINEWLSEHRDIFAS